MANKVGGAKPGIGLDMGYYAIMTEDTAGTAAAPGTVKYDEPVQLLNLKETDINPNESVVEGFYDNKLNFADVSTGGAAVTMTKDNFDSGTRAALLGETLVSGVYFSGVGLGDGVKRPYVAVGYRRALGNGVYRYVWLLKCIAVDGAEKSTTKEKTITLQDSQMTFSAINRMADGMWKMSVRTDDEDYDPLIGESWFTAATLQKLATAAE